MPVVLPQPVRGLGARALYWTFLVAVRRGAILLRRTARALALATAPTARRFRAVGARRCSLALAGRKSPSFGAPRTGAQLQPLANRSLYRSLALGLLGRRAEPARAQRRARSRRAAGLADAS